MIPSIIHLSSYTHTHIYEYAIEYVLEQNLHVYWHLRSISLFLNECVHPTGWLDELVFHFWLFHIYNLWRVTKYKEKKKKWKQDWTNLIWLEQLKLVAHTRIPHTMKCHMLFVLLMLSRHTSLGICYFSLSFLFLGQPSLHYVCVQPTKLFMNWDGLPCN